MIAFVRGPVVGRLRRLGRRRRRRRRHPGHVHARLRWSSLRVGEEATLATSMVVREDSLTLFGFADYDERGIFELLQTASGVGPKLAQAMLAVHGPDELRRAITTEDLVSLCKVPGIGRKGAQRIVLELKDQIGAPTRQRRSARSRVQRSADGRAGATRCGPACSGSAGRPRRPRRAVEAVAPMADEAVAAGDAVPVADLLRAALRSLSKA